MLRLGEDWLPEDLRRLAERRQVAPGWELPFSEQRDGRLVAYFAPDGRLTKAVRVVGQSVLARLSLDPDGSLYLSDGQLDYFYRDGQVTVGTPYDGDSPAARRPATAEDMLAQAHGALFMTPCGAAWFFFEASDVTPESTWPDASWLPPGVPARFHASGRLASVGWSGYRLVLDEKLKRGTVYHPECGEQPFERLEDDRIYEEWVRRWIGIIASEG